MASGVPERSWQLIASPISDAGGPSHDIDLSQMDVRFKVHKTLTPKPNTADIKIWGLSSDTRQVLESASRLSVKLRAGYNGNNEQLFLGETRNAYTKILERTSEVETFLETGTSLKDMQASHVSASYGSQILLKDAFAAISAALPRLSPDLPDRWIQANSASFIMHPAGGAVDRSTMRLIDDYCRSAGLEWSIQDEILQVLPRNQVKAGQQILISSDTGMVGSPSVNHKGEVRVRSFIQPGLHPGAPIRVEGRSISGDFRIESVVYDGDTSPGAQDWYVDMTCSTVGQGAT